MANTAQVVIVGVIAVAAFLIVVLIPTSFSDVEYYEVGFFILILSTRKDWSSTNATIIALNNIQTISPVLILSISSLDTQQFHSHIAVLL